MGIESSMGQHMPPSKEERQKSYEEEQRAQERRHSQDDAFLAKAGPEWNEKELPKPEGEWLQVDAAGRESDAYEDYGTYSTNNNMIAYCSKVKGGGGVVWIAPFSTERVNALNAAGYKKSGLGVPFSNGGMPFEMKNKWDTMFGKNE